MKMYTMTTVLALCFAVVMPLAADAHKQDAACNMQGMDMSKLTAEQKQQMQAKCAAQMHDKNCAMSGMDMSTMSAEGKQNMMMQCNDKNASDSTAMPSVPATPAIPATPAEPAAHNHNGGS